jgi:hypothetical protein
MRLMLIAVLMLVGCTNQKEPAQVALGNVEAIIIASSGDAAKYAPDQLMDVQSKLGRLQASFDRKDYSAVVAGAPEAMTAAHGLISAAAAGKAKADKALNEQWTVLAATIPDYMAAIRRRIDLLNKKSSRRLAAGIDLGAASERLDGAVSLWSKVQAAFATGNMPEAVSAAQRLKMDLETQAGPLMLNLAALPEV